MARLQVTVAQREPAEVETPLLVLPWFEDEAEPAGAAAAVDGRMGGEVARVLRRGDFRGRGDETLVLFPREGELGAERVLLVGLGKRERYTMERLRRAVGAAVRKAERLGIASLALALDHEDGVGEQLGAHHVAQAAAEGAGLAAWSFREFKTREDEHRPQPPESLGLVLLARDAAEAEALEEGGRWGVAAARGENLARDLASRPGNVATPAHLAEVAQRIGEEHGIEVTVLGPEELRRERMGALLAVAAGSEEEPRLIVMEYRGADTGAGPLVLVGKGVTFDAGGISLKPSEKMEDMKYDMGGAAAVLGAMQAIAELRIPAHVVALVPATENLPSGRALKPGDIISGHAGKTIEVVNTDAEGRLILSDALSYAQRYGPQAMLDAATLTGSCIVALGHHAVAVMGTDEALVEELRAAGERTGERCWPLPLWDEYRPQIDSAFADLKNTGGRPAGSITAGWFLKEFVGDVPWAHLDIAGTAWRDEATPYQRRGATGIPTRLFVEWVRSRVER